MFVNKLPVPCIIESALLCLRINLIDAKLFIYVHGCTAMAVD